MTSHDITCLHVCVLELREYYSAVIGTPNSDRQPNSLVHVVQPSGVTPVHLLLRATSHDPPSPMKLKDTFDFCHCLRAELTRPFSTPTTSVWLSVAGEDLVGVSSSSRANGDSPSVSVAVPSGSFGDDVAGPNAGVDRFGVGVCDTGGGGVGGA